MFNTPIHGNIGDHAIILAEYKVLKENGIKIFEVPTFREKYCFKYLKNKISKDGIIGITGGGFIGSQWTVEQNLVNKVVENFYDRKIIIFPCTIFFKNDDTGIKELEKSKKIFNKAKNITIFAREQKTFEFVKNSYNNCKVFLVPDIVLTLSSVNYDLNRDGILFCMRKDEEKSMSNTMTEKIEKTCHAIGEKLKFTDTVAKNFIDVYSREKVFNNKLSEFAKSKLVITDRLHGMIFAALTNTPCIVFGNYNYKVKGVYEWIKGVPFIKFVENCDDIEKEIKELLNYDTNIDCIELINKKDCFKELFNLVKEI